MRASKPVDLPGGARVSADTFGPFPEPGWSFSRDRALEECARLYYHKVFGSWGGWSAGPDTPAWRAYRLKHLVTVEQVVGIEVHERARELVRAIREGRPRPTEAELLDRCWEALGRLRQADVRSFLLRPKARPLLRRVYYGEQVDWEALFQSAGSSLERCIAALAASPVLDDVGRCAPTGILLPEPFDRVPFTVDGRPVHLWAAPDLVLSPPVETPCPSGRILEIIDWKTGGGRGAEDQVAIYAVFLRARLRVPFAEGRYHGRVVSLADGTESRFILRRDDFIAAADRIAAGVREMRSFLADADSGRPLHRGAFPMVAEEGRWRCARCSFAEICDHGS